MQVISGTELLHKLCVQKVYCVKLMNTECSDIIYMNTNALRWLTITTTSVVFFAVTAKRFFTKATKKYNTLAATRHDDE